MVFQKSLDNRFNSYSAPTIPRVPRSAKGKRSPRRKVKDNQMYAFDLLAFVAGELLLEREGFLNPNETNGPLSVTINGGVKHERLEEAEEKVIKDDGFDQGSCNESTLEDATISLQRHGIYLSKDLSYTPILPSIAGNADVSDEDIKPAKLQSNGIRGKFGHNLGIGSEKYSSKRHSLGFVESCEGKVEDGIKTSCQTERQMNAKQINDDAPNMVLVDSMELDATPTALVSSDSSFEVPPYGNRGRCNRNGVELAVDRDDNDNSSGCTCPIAVVPNASRLHRFGDRRIRNLLASKQWKTFSKKEQLSNIETKPNFRGTKFCCTRHRTQRSSFKRRKVLTRCSMSAFKESTVEARNSCEILPRVNGVSSSVRGQRPSFESDDFHVELSIKSFKVPELLIEIPETATIGSLKRTVMEAVTAVFGVGLHVGVLLQGKKVRDDNKTLSQVGISRGNKLDSLGFTLEPHTKPDAPTLENPIELHLLPCDAAQPLSRFPSVVPTKDPGTSGANLEAPLIPIVSTSESYCDSVQSPAEANSRALVPVPLMTVGVLSAVPLRKSKRSELVQRKIRRPFSVAEVEALVQAVEKLGTVRWRDVKLQAFDSAKHRTYVDLKDKWKTLVHTAQISPQQRRGEPVPQELLDRVLAAHAYWSQQQAKLQAKLPIAGACLLH